MRSTGSQCVAQRAAQLRQDFDRGFAEPVRTDAAVREDLLGIRVGAQTYALRLKEIAGLHADKRITRVPGAHPALRGIAGFRGAVVPVYDLHALLGGAAAPSPRWLVVAASSPVAVAFEAFEGHLRVLPSEISPSADPSSVAPDIVRLENFTGPILNLPSILESARGYGTEANVGATPA